MRTKVKAEKCAKTGRPACVSPERILESAEPLFAERGFEGTSTREIAKLAKCNSAMIAYHFGNKEGLYLAILDRYARAIQDPFRDGLRSDAELKKAWPELKIAEERELCAALFDAAQTIVLNNCMHKIFSREMMSGGGRVVKLLSKRDGGAIGPLRDLLKRFQRTGAMRSDFDWRFAVLSMIGPLVYSNLASPVLLKIYGFKAIDEEYVRGLCVYLAKTLFEGRG